MDTSDIIWIVVAVLVLLALAALLAAVMRKRKAAQAQEARVHAQHLRTEAAAQTGGLQRSRIEAQEAELRAERARLEADQARARAEVVKQGHLAEEARVEDRLREADRLDPDVDHRSDGYRPTPPTQGTAPAPGATAGHQEVPDSHPDGPPAPGSGSSPAR